MRSILMALLILDVNPGALNRLLDTVYGVETPHREFGEDIWAIASEIVDSWEMEMESEGMLYEARTLANVVRPAIPETLEKALFTNDQGEVLTDLRTTYCRSL